MEMYCSQAYMPHPPNSDMGKAFYLLMMFKSLPWIKYNYINHPKSFDWITEHQFNLPLCHQLQGKDLKPIKSKPGDLGALLFS